ncbi:MAG TPA: hypothetical protein VNK94_10905 [Gaiellaceae bacterium]|jgi:hypothetical protein|nr:hypothetical protein [Gaiellaceae bacterium]
MRGRIWTTVAGLATVAALVAVPSALAAYTSPQLTVRQAGTTVTIKASLDPNDDPTASVRILAPGGTTFTTSQAPGTVLGPVKALVKALDLAGADLPLEGQLVVAAPGQVPAAAQAACLQEAVPAATWVMVLNAAGQTLNVPMYLVATPGGPSPGFLQVCLPPPDVPASNPNRAAFGAKLYSAELTIGGVFSAVPVGAWISLWTPYVPTAGLPNVPGTVAAPAAIAPGAVTVAAKSSGAGAIVSGRVTQAGQPRGGVTVAIFGGTTKTGLKRLGSTKVNAAGAYTFKAKKGTFFRARAVAGPASAAPLCAALAAQLGGLPCVNPTVNGFTVDSKVVKKR